VLLCELDGVFHWFFYGQCVVLWSLVSYRDLFSEKFSFLALFLDSHSYKSLNVKHEKGSFCVPFVVFAT
jgi:hypothetical protein